MQVFVWRRDNRMPFPVRRMQRRSHPVVWVEPRYAMVLAVLNNPVYAGAYAFGKSKTICAVDPEDPRQIAVRKRRVRQSDPPVLITDHHPAYISYAQHRHNRVAHRQYELRGDVPDSVELKH